MSGQFLDEEAQFQDYTAMDRKSLGSPKAVTYTNSTIDNSE